jgi:hypothetical protein
MSANQDLCAAGAQAMLDAAKGVLIALYGYDLEAAATELVRVARGHELDIFVLAEALLTVASTHTGQRDGAVGTQVVADEWGEELCFCRMPARASVCR